MENLSNREIAIHLSSRDMFGGETIAESNAAFNAAMEMGKLKDEQHEQEKQLLIDKACEWIKEQATYYAHWEWNGDTYTRKIVFDSEECIEDFKKTLKGE